MQSQGACQAFRNTHQGRIAVRPGRFRRRDYAQRPSAPLIRYASTGVERASAKMSGQKARTHRYRMIANDGSDTGEIDRRSMITSAGLCWAVLPRQGPVAEEGFNAPRWSPYRVTQA
jgi:hypothetical protein